jgi:hypothetical protein
LESRLQVSRWMSKWHGVVRVDEVVSRARRAGCRLGRRRASGLGVGRIVENVFRARRAGCS